MFFFPVMMADNVGYLMPNLQEMESLFGAASTASWPCILHPPLLPLHPHPASAGTAAVPTTRATVPWQRSMHANTSLLFMHCANPLQKCDSALDPASRVSAVPTHSQPAASLSECWNPPSRAIQKPEIFSWLCVECCVGLFEIPPLRPFPGLLETYRIR